MNPLDKHLEVLQENLSKPAHEYTPSQRDLLIIVSAIIDTRQQIRRFIGDVQTLIAPSEQPRISPSEAKNRKTRHR